MRPACGKEAEKTAKIIRKGTIGAKKVTAKFSGVAVEGGKAFSDNAACK